MLGYNCIKSSLFSHISQRIKVKSFLQGHQTPLACGTPAEFPEANCAPALSMLFRHEPTFSADLTISGVSVVFFALALDINSDAKEST